MTPFRRAQAYLRQLPGSIAGQDGDHCLYMAAIHLVVGFDLDFDDTLELLQEFNARKPDGQGRGGCSPPWPSQRLVYKIEQALQYAEDHDDEVGYLLSRGKNSFRKPSRSLQKRASSEGAKVPSEQRSPLDEEELRQVESALAERPSIVKIKPKWPSECQSDLPEREEDDWNAFLRLFEPNDIIWIGRRWDSGEPKHQGHFQSRNDWEDLPFVRRRRVDRLVDSTHSLLPTNFGEFSCGSTFKPGSFSRCDENVLHRRFLVTEMDEFGGIIVPKPEQAALIEWLREWLNLRSVVDSGGKSLHAMWDFPNEATLRWLSLILPPLGFDPAMFRPSQPCRLAGAVRADRGWKYQKLLFVDAR